MSNPEEQRPWDLAAELDHLKSVVGGGVLQRDDTPTLRKLGLADAADAITKSLVNHAGDKFPVQWFHLARATSKGAAALLVEAEWARRPGARQMNERDEGMGEELLIDALCVLGPQGSPVAAELLAEYGLTLTDEHNQMRQPTETRSLVERTTAVTAGGVPFAQRLRRYFRERLNEDLEKARKARGGI